MSKKILAILMAVAMAFSLLPVTALAGNTSLLSITPPGEGKFATYEFYTSKTAENPCYTQIVKTGDTLKRPADPTLAGSHFTGWKTADGKEVPFGTVTVKETSIIKCYAKWEENKNPIHVYFMAAIGSNEVVLKTKQLPFQKTIRILLGKRQTVKLLTEKMSQTI